MATEYYTLRVQGMNMNEYNECVLTFKGTNLIADDWFDNANDLIDAWLAGVMTLWQEMFPSQYQVMRLSAKRLLPAGGVELVRQFQDGDFVGQANGSPASNQLCPVVRLIPPMGTKTAGKFFLPCISEDDINANLVTAGWLSDLANLMTQLISTFSATAIVWAIAIYSPKLGTAQLALDYDTSAIVGFQRRRQRPY